jgi:hypothetical protein
MTTSVATPEATTTPATEVDAVEMLRGALTDIQKLVNYLTHLDVRQNVSIETLVPVVLTPQERALAVQKMFDDTKALQMQISSHALSSQLQAKISHGQREIDKKLGLATSAMQKGELDKAQSLVKEANAIAIDLQKLVANEPLKGKEILPVVKEVVATSTAAVIAQ